MTASSKHLFTGILPSNDKSIKWIELLNNLELFSYNLLLTPTPHLLTIQSNFYHFRQITSSVQQYASSKSM